MRDRAHALEVQGPTVIYVAEELTLVGFMGVADTLRPEETIAIVTGLQAEGVVVGHGRRWHQRGPGLGPGLGILLAALGWLPPIGATAAQSFPDLAVMLNSSRLVRPPLVSSIPRREPGGRLL
jgi:cation transport ATPase